MHPRLGKKAYELLGQTLIRKRPDVAEELLPFCQVNGEETDMSLIPEFFNRFCLYLKLPPSDYRGKLYNQDKLKFRRLFVGSMLRIYNQQLFFQPDTTPVMHNGFVTCLTNCTGVSVSSMSQMIRQVLFDEKTYEEFRLQLDDIVIHLKPSNGHDQKKKAV